MGLRRPAMPSTVDFRHCSWCFCKAAATNMDDEEGEAEEETAEVGEMPDKLGLRC